MASSPDAQAKLLAELDALPGAPDREVTVEDLQLVRGVGWGEGRFGGGWGWGALTQGGQLGRGGGATLRSLLRGRDTCGCCDCCVACCSFALRQTPLLPSPSPFPTLHSCPSPPL